MGHLAALPGKRSILTAMTQKEPETSSWATVIGGSYAYLQHGMDKVIEWGFSQMKKAADEQKAAPAKESQNPYIANTKALARKTMRFLGATGRAYYDTYRDLKKRDSAS
jgi:hypothetical protein